MLGFSLDGRRAADAEMARVLHTTPFRMALDASGAGIAHWKHEPLHDVVEPMSHHVIMAYNGVTQRMERRSGRSIANGTFRPGVLIIIPEGSSSRWDIPKPVDVVQLYLPHATLKRVADEAQSTTPADLLEVLRGVTVEYRNRISGYYRDPVKTAATCCR